MSFITTNKKHNYFYRTTNQINWKYYFGIHSTDNLDDGYLGTGNLIKVAIKKYGKENFVRTIIADYPTRKEASDHERLAITTFQVEDENCYNIKPGGDNELSIPREIIEKANITRKLNGRKNPHEGKTWEEFFGVDRAKEMKLNHSKSHLGLKRTDISKKKISDALTGRTFSESHIKNMIISNKSRDPNSYNSKRVQINGIEYRNCKEASEQLKMNKTTISGRVRSKDEKWKDWFYLDAPYHTAIATQEIIIQRFGKKCLIHGIKFDCLRDVAKKFQIQPQTVKRRIASNDNEWKDWKFYIEEI